MGLKLKVNNQEIPLNDFVESILDGMIVGAVTALKGIRDNWEKIEINITK